MPLPFAYQAAIKRAKKAIQAYILDPENEKKYATAVVEVNNADEVVGNGNRKYWRQEVLMVPHYGLVPTSWYAKTFKVEQWSLERMKMPEWAKNGKLEPDLGVNILGHAYTTPPKSAER
jgi:hypothetical protein